MISLPHQVEQFRGLLRLKMVEGGESASLKFEMALWTIVIIYSLVFLGNIIFTSVVLHGIRLKQPLHLKPWVGWSVASFFLLGSVIIFKSFTLAFSLPDLIICLACAVVNLYLGLLLYSLRKLRHESEKESKPV